jgi:polyisoprenoid-binding protein YceI
MKRITGSVKYFGMILFLVALSKNTVAQKFYTKSGKIVFFSKAPLENIEAENKTATAILDTRNGQIQFNVLVKGFEFEKALMQEHFNENYMESSKYPKASFAGQIQNSAEINYAKNGNYKAVVKGMLTIHGVTKELEATGSINVINGFPTLNADLVIALADYKISIPSLVKDKISSTVKVTINCILNNSLK